MKTITEPIITERVTGYEAKDGTFFKDREECAKYENTCKCVLMEPYNKLIRKYVSEYDLYDTGSEEAGYHVIDIKSDVDVETVNKVLKFHYDGARLVDSSYRGILLVFYNCDGTIDGFFNTPSELINDFETRIALATSL